MSDERLEVNEDGLVPYKGELNFEFRSFLNAFSSLQENQINSIKADCKLAHSALNIKNSSYSEGTTFFLKANEEPRCSLEQIVQEIFNFHTKDAIFDKSKSGAEWWSLVMDVDDDVQWHFDKDYALEGESDLNLHPHIATVTYFTDIGSPTVIIEKTETLNLDEDFSGSASCSIISKPSVGKHMAFNGSYLHAAPIELKPLFHKDLDEEEEEKMEDIAVKKDKNKRSLSPTSNFATKNKKKRMKGDKFKDFTNKRVTLLVNIWLNHLPVDAIKFPSKILSKVSKLNVRLNKDMEESKCFRIQVENGKKGLSLHTWHFGEDDKHSITMFVPSASISENKHKSDAFQIVYKDKKTLINVT